MQGAATQAMPACIVEERQRRRCRRAAGTRRAHGGCGRALRCSSSAMPPASPPPRASISPRKPHARDPCYYSDRLLGCGQQTPGSARAAEGLHWALIGMVAMPSASRSWKRPFVSRGPGRRTAGPARLQIGIGAGDQGPGFTQILNGHPSRSARRRQPDATSSTAGSNWRCCGPPNLHRCLRAASSI